MNIDFLLLKKEFATDRNVIEADWNEWLKKTSFQLLKQSPDPILHACANVAEVYNQIAQELYNVAFLTLWKILPETEKDNIMRSINASIGVKTYKPRAVL